MSSARTRLGVALLVACAVAAGCELVVSSVERRPFAEDGGSGGTGGTAAGSGGTGETAGGAGAGGGGGGDEPVCGSPDTGPTGLSCVGLADSCGPGEDEDCCANLLVPCGTYFRSYDGLDYPDDNYPATVSDFYLDRFEVTVGRFRAFVDVGKGTEQDPSSDGEGAHEFIPGSGWQPAWNTELPFDTVALKAALKCNATNQTWTDSPGANENKPINCVSWYLAFAFCAWDGGRLPTEAEWNYAAAGGDQQRYFPWSDPYPPGSTDINDTYAVHDYCCGIPEVGSRSPKGDGRWGQADLAGSMWEWNLDWYGTYPTPCNDCANCESVFAQVLRGGSWYTTANYLRSARRYFRTPTERDGLIGLRCARNTGSACEGGDLTEFGSNAACDECANAACCEQVEAFVNNPTQTTYGDLVDCARGETSPGPCYDDCTFSICESNLAIPVIGDACTACLSTSGCCDAWDACCAEQSGDCGGDCDTDFACLTSFDPVGDGCCDITEFATWDTCVGTYCSDVCWDSECG